MTMTPDLLVRLYRDLISCPFVIFTKKMKNYKRLNVAEIKNPKNYGTLSIMLPEGST